MGKAACAHGDEVRASNSHRSQSRGSISPPTGDLEHRESLALAERREAHALAGLREREAQRALAETRRIQAEARMLDFDLFRRKAFFVMAIAVALLLSLRLLEEPALLETAGGSGLLAALGWLARR